MAALKLKPDPAPLCFEVFIKVGAGLSELAQRRFERDLDEWLSGQGLESDGSLLRRTIFSASRDMTAQDQVDVMLWLQQEASRLGSAINVWVGELVSGDGSDSRSSEPGTWAWHGDEALGHLLGLYALGRIRGAVVLETLRGEG
jgi:hypothetical protein